MKKLIKDEGIILRTLKYGETSMIMDVLTSQNGKQSMIANGVRKSKSAFSPATIMVSCCNEFVYYHDENGGLQRIKEAKSLLYNFDLSTNPVKLAISLFICEITNKSIANQDINTPIYLLLKETLTFINNNDHHIANIPIWFLLQLAELNGLGISKQEWSSERMSNISTYQLLSLNQIQLLESFKSSKIDQIFEFKLNRKERLSLIEHLIFYMDEHYSTLKSIKSIQILHEILSD